MSTTALDIITDAAKLLGLIYKTETLSSDEANDGLIQLNDMLDSWSNDNLCTFARATETFNLTGAGSYTIGIGGTFNTVRPISIDNALVTMGTIDYPLAIITQDQYQAIPFKTVKSSIPQYLVYDNGYPLGQIKLYTLDIGGTLTMQSDKPLMNLALLTTVVSLPPGWSRALKYNLAEDMAAQYGVQVPDTVSRNARLSLGAIKRATAVNTAMPLLTDDVVSRNIFSGWYI